MRVAFFGDIVGKTGRQKLESSLEQYVAAEKIDFVVANAENATSGAGLSASHAEDLLNASVDCITLGLIPFGYNIQQESLGHIPHGSGP